MTASTMDQPKSVLPTVEILTTAAPPTPIPAAISAGAQSPTTPAPAIAPPTPFPTASLVPHAQEPRYEDRTGATSLLASYYNAINRREYARAWGYWQDPPSSSYEHFVQGFADTASVVLAVRPPTWFEGAAGSVYVNIPALLSATHTDGTRHNFLGCFVARRPNLGGTGGNQVWSLFDATVHRTPGNRTEITLLEQACGPP